ncbi:hypothetical protein SRHO_G00139930 [Serrasalmus rhombeus]
MSVFVRVIKAARQQWRFSEVQYGAVKLPGTPGLLEQHAGRRGGKEMKIGSVSRNRSWGNTLVQLCAACCLV